MHPPQDVLVQGTVELRKSQSSSGTFTRFFSWFKAGMFESCTLFLTRDGKMFYEKGAAVKKVGVLKKVTR